MNKIFILIIILFFVCIGMFVVWQNLQTTKEKLIPEIISSERQEKFRVIKRIPEGTQSGWVERDKVVQSPLAKVSVVFNKDINESTLTLDNFYALWGIDDKMPSIIRYNKNTKTASLIFNEEIRGGTRITIIINGVKDLQANEIKELLYNVDVIE